MDLKGTESHTLRATRQTLGAAFETIRPRLELVEHFIARQLAAAPQTVQEAGRYVLEGGGKRLRPALLLVGARLVGYEGERDIRYGAVVEMIHTATLVHDDIIDHASVRRGRATANDRWGNQLTVLLGDWLYIRSMELALELGDTDVLRVLSRATVEMVEGEILALEILGKDDVTY
jgi:octaprenyl-diphosphate synthase